MIHSLWNKFLFRFMILWLAEIPSAFMFMSDCVTLSRASETNKGLKKDITFLIIYKGEQSSTIKATANRTPEHWIPFTLCSEEEGKIRIKKLNNKCNAAGQSKIVRRWVSLESRPHFCHIRVACLFPFIYFAYFMQVLPQHQGWRVGGNKSVRCHLAPLPFGWHLRVLRHFWLVPPLPSRKPADRNKLITAHLQGIGDT